MGSPLSSEKKLAWGENLRKQKESGLSIDRWCNENQIRTYTFRYWKERLFPKPLPSRLSFSELPDASKRLIKPSSNERSSLLLELLAA